MTVIRHVHLGMRSGSTDHQFEVLLVQNDAGRFQVQVRYGRAGQELTTAERTTWLVNRSAAETVFENILVERRRRGFVPRVVVRPTDRAARDTHFVALIEAGDRKKLGKFLFRAGELRIRAAAVPIGQLVPRDNLEAWNIARALLRCGDPLTAHAAWAIATNARWPEWVRSMARHAVEVLGGPGRDVVLAEADATEWPAKPKEVEAHVLDNLYLRVVARGDDGERQRFEAVLAETYSFGAPFAAVRRVYKIAEARADGRTWGLLARRFEREVGVGGSRPARGVLPPVPSPGTQPYLRRRNWRTLRRLAEGGLEEEYCRMAAGLILAYSDEDLLSRRGRPWVAGDWALGQVLYGPYAETRPKKLRIVTLPTGVPRPESYPELWDRAPAQLAEILVRSRLGPAHAFARAALAANEDRWSNVSLSSILEMFEAPYAETRRFAAVMGIHRYDPSLPDPQLLLGLLESRDPDVTARAREWVFAGRDQLLGTVQFATRILLSSLPEVRALAAEWFAAGPLPSAFGRALVDAVVERTEPVGELDLAGEALWMEVRTVLSTSFSESLSQLPLDVVLRLLRIRSEGRAGIGAQALLVHVQRPAEWPDDVLAAAMSSPFAAIRAIGVRLYGELPDAILAERFRVLLDLLTGDHAEVRALARPIVARLCAGSPSFARVLFASLMPLLLAASDDGVVRDGARVLREDLQPAMGPIDSGAVFRLLRAPHTILQELGGEWLRAHVDPRTITFHQLGILASSDVAVLREAAFAIARHRLDGLRGDPSGVLPLLDARWEDSRARAFRFVREELGAAALPTHVVLAICDSMRPDVQAFGRSLVRDRLTPEEGPRCLVHLAQHPALAMQSFACEWLEAYAARQPARIAALAPFVVTVLAQPNVGRVAKQRLFAFLDAQIENRACAEVLAPLIAELVLTVAVSHRARYVEALTRIRALYPDIDGPLRVVPPEVRGVV